MMTVMTMMMTLMTTMTTMVRKTTTFSPSGGPRNCSVLAPRLAALVASQGR